VFCCNCTDICVLSTVYTVNKSCIYIAEHCFVNLSIMMSSENRTITYARILILTNTGQFLLVIMCISVSSYARAFVVQCMGVGPCWVGYGLGWIIGVGAQSTLGGQESQDIFCPKKNMYGKLTKCLNFM